MILFHSLYDCNKHYNTPLCIVSLYRTSLISAINSLQYTSGGANISAGLRYALSSSFSPSAGDRVEFPNVLILITSSSSNNEQATLEAAALCRRSEIYVIVLAIGNWLNLYEVNNIASQPYSKNVIFLNDYQSLNNSISGIRNLYCNSKLAFIDVVTLNHWTWKETKKYL